MKKIIMIGLIAFNLHVHAMQCPSAEHFIFSNNKWSLDAQSISLGWRVNSASAGSRDSLKHAEMQVDLYIKPHPGVICEYITGYETAVIAENKNQIQEDHIPQPPFVKLTDPDSLDYSCRTTADRAQHCNWN